MQNAGHSIFLIDLVLYEEVGGELSGGEFPDGGVAIASETDDGVSDPVSGIAESASWPFPVEAEGLVDGAGTGIIWNSSDRKGRKPFGNVTR